MTNIIKKSVKTVLVAILAITAIIVGSIPMEASAMSVYEPTINENCTYDYDKSSDTLVINGYADQAVIDKYSDASYIEIVDAKVENISFKDSKASCVQFNMCDLTSAKVELSSNVNDFAIYESKVNNLKFVSSTNYVTYLTLSCSEVGSIEGVQNFTNLESLFISAVGIEDITPVKYLNKLEYLTLDYTCVEDLSPIKNLNISCLDVCNSMNIESLDVVMEMDSIERIWTRNCEMAYSRELYDYLNENNIDHDIPKSDLAIKGKVENLADELMNDNMSDEEKVETVVSYVVDLMEYDFGIYENEDLSRMYNDDALEFALKGEGVCRNYSALINVLLIEGGVESKEIRNVDHIWNIVFIDGEYYWIDATWIDDGCTVDINDNIYYCNTDYYFVDHDLYTVPSSVYNMENNTNTDTDYDEIYEENNDEEQIIEETTQVEEVVETTTVKPQMMETRIGREGTFVKPAFETENTDTNMNETIISISIATIIMAATSIIVLLKKYAKSN